MITPTQADQSAPSGKWESNVKGIGGVFMKFENPELVNSWYQQNLGMDVKDHGYTFYMWRDFEAPSIVHRTVWTAFPSTSEHFGKVEQHVMINYIVEDLDGFLHELKERGVIQVGEIETYDYGRFAWILDIEGNKVELWEPSATNDSK
ncbi:MAG: glyoxalase [Hyphococcus sp.]|nr:MAG: glyoxalase [Marinicaulis sp.]